MYTSYTFANPVFSASCNYQLTKVVCFVNKIICIPVLTRLASTQSIEFILKSVDGVLGIRTWGRRMVVADETTELWRPPQSIEFMMERFY